VTRNTISLISIVSGSIAKSASFAFFPVDFTSASCASLPKRVALSCLVANTTSFVNSSIPGKIIS
jgi:hypothetical protein